MIKFVRAWRRQMGEILIERSNFKWRLLMDLIYVGQTNQTVTQVRGFFVVCNKRRFTNIYYI